MHLRSVGCDPAPPQTGDETRTVADNGAQVPNELGKPREQAEHLAILLTTNSFISGADRIFA